MIYIEMLNTLKQCPLHRFQRVFAASFRCVCVETERALAKNPGWRELYII